MPKLSLNGLLRRLQQRGLPTSRRGCPAPILLILEGRFDHGGTFAELEERLPDQFPEVFPEGRLRIEDAGDQVDVQLSARTISNVCRKVGPRNGRNRVSQGSRSGPIARLASQGRHGLWCVDGYAVDAPEVFRPILEAYHVDGFSFVETARRVASTSPEVTFEVDGRMHTRKCDQNLVAEVVNTFGTPRPRSTTNVITPSVEGLIEHDHFELGLPIAQIYRESPELRRRFVSPEALRACWNDHRFDRPLRRTGGIAGLRHLRVAGVDPPSFAHSDWGAWMLGYLIGDGWFTQQSTGSLRMGVASAWYDAAGPMWVRRILTGRRMPASLEEVLACTYPKRARPAIAALPVLENPLTNPRFRFVRHGVGMKSTKLDRDRPFIREVSSHPALVDPDYELKSGERPRVSCQYSLMHPWVDEFVDTFGLHVGAGKSHNARVPVGPVSARWFLRGLDCADGCFAASDKGTPSAGLTWSLVSASEPLIEQVIAMVERELDIASSCRPAHRGDREYSQVVLSGRNVATFARWLYGTHPRALPGPVIPRKMERAQFCARSR